MVLSKRERLILIATVLVLGALIGDRFVVKPIKTRLEQTEVTKQQLLAELNQAQSLFERRRLLERKWKTVLSDGLRSGAEAESRIARALDQWSSQARLTLSSVKPERVASDKGLQEMTFTVAGRGNMYAVAQFLWQVETASLPIKVKDMQLGSTSEGGESMSLQVRLSALYLDSAKQTDGNKPTQLNSAEATDEELL